MMLTSLCPSLTPPAMRPNPSLSPSPFALNTPTAQAKPAYGFLTEFALVAAASIVAIGIDQMPSDQIRHIGDVFHRSAPQMSS